MIDTNKQAKKANAIIIRDLGRQEYTPIWHKMQMFTDERSEQTPDEIWLVEHDAVYTQGQAGKPEHLLNPNNIPVVQVDRGGQITYHGPGQLVMYTLIHMRGSKIGVRDLVSALEQSIVLTLEQFNIDAYPKKDAPGVYVKEQKICSVGLRIRKGSSFHGLAFNVNMNLDPFKGINPCGYAGLEMTDSARLGGVSSLEEAKKIVVKHFCDILNIETKLYREGFND